MSTDICIACGQEKSLAEFYPDPQISTGHKCRCIPCYKQMQKAWQKENLKHLAEKSKTWREAHPEQKQRHKAYCKNYYRNHMAWFRLYYGNHIGDIRDYYRDHKGQIAMMQGLWRKAHPEYNTTYYKSHLPSIIARVMAYRARKKNAPGIANEDQIQARVDFYGGHCWICGKPFQAIDHVIPLSKGGTNWPANLRPICKRCNAQKNNRWPWPPERFPTLCSRNRTK